MVEVYINKYFIFIVQHIKNINFHILLDNQYK
jgi:hypothetical protein